MTAGAIRSPLLATLIGLTLLDVGALEPAAGRPRIEELSARRDGDGVVVSFRVANAFGEETLERVQSGIPVTFKHRLRVMARRTLPLLPAREIGRTRIEARVTYDALTGQYALTRELDFRSKKDARAPQRSTETTDSPVEMRRWMTEFTDVPIFDPEPGIETPLVGAKLRIRADSNLGRKFVLLVFPTTRGDSAEVTLAP